MKIGGIFEGLNISGKGMSINKKKMDLIAENIANSETTRTNNGEPYKRKLLKVSSNDNKLVSFQFNPKINLKTTEEVHFNSQEIKSTEQYGNTINMNEVEDNKMGDLVYMPEHPDANKDGYVQMPNVNIVNEMTDMIVATRSYEANLTAFNSSKQIAKDSLDI